MARYFFDMRDGDELIADEEGVEFLTIDAVQHEAAHALSDMARDEVRLTGNGPARHMAIEVRDGDGPVMHATFSFEIKRLQ
jgi:hypothetical protein